MGKFREKIRLWYYGAQIKPEHALANKIARMGGHPPVYPGGRHWTARLVRWLFHDPKWLIPTVISIIALLKN
jgi:hypothetical protein